MDQRFSSLLLMVVVFGVLYFCMIRPDSKRRKETQKARDAMKKGDYITTIGGIMGRVVSVNEESFVIETSEDRVRIEFSKFALSSVNEPPKAKNEKKEEALPEQESEEN